MSKKFAAKAFSEADRQKFLEERHVAVLSVAADDGRPPASVPIWYDCTPEGNIRFMTGPSRRKAKLVDKAGVVTLVVQREELPYQHVIVEGTVVDTVEPTPPAAQEAIAARYLGEEGGREYVSRRLDGRESKLYTVRPDRWFTADYSGGPQ